jgi:hypothetical protein
MSLPLGAVDLMVKIWSHLYSPVFWYVIFPPSNEK